MNSTVPGADVAARRGRPRRPRRPSRARGLGVEQRRRRLLDDLLVPPLQAALALAEVDRRCRAASASTWTSMCRGPVDVPLEQQRVVAEGADAPRAGAAISACGQLARARDDAHALAAAAGRRLEQHRVSRPRRRRRASSVVGQPGPVAPRARPGTPAAATVALARILSPIASMRRRRRADEDERRPRRRRARSRRSRRGTRSPGWTACGAGRRGRVEDGVDRQVALRGRRGPIRTATSARAHVRGVRRRRRCRRRPSGCRAAAACG